MTIELFPYFEFTAAGKRASGLMRTHELTTKKIFESVLDALLQAELTLIEGRLYTAEKVCGPLLWTAWVGAEHTVAGMCMAFFVRNGLVSFIAHRIPSDSGTKRYRAIKLQVTQS